MSRWILQPWGLSPASHRALLPFTCFPSAHYTSFKLLSVSQLVICTGVSQSLAPRLHIPCWCFWSYGGLSAADCLYHTFRLLAGLVTKVQVTEFNLTLIPNHTSQGSKLLAEESALWQGPKISAEQKQQQTWYGAKDDNQTSLVSRNGETWNNSAVTDTYFPNKTEDFMTAKWKLKPSRYAARCGNCVPHVMTFLIVCEVMGCLPTVADSLESRDLRR